MKRFVLLLVSLLLLINSSKAQTLKIDIINKGKSFFIEHGNVVVIKNTTGEKLKGKLFFIHDSILIYGNECSIYNAEVINSIKKHGIQEDGNIVDRGMYRIIGDSMIVPSKYLLSPDEVVFLKTKDPNSDSKALAALGGIVSGIGTGVGSFYALVFIAFSNDLILSPLSLLIPVGLAVLVGVTVAKAIRLKKYHSSKCSYQIIHDSGAN